MSLVSLGQVAYEAYCSASGWKSLVSGAPLPRFQDTNSKIREAWEAAAIEAVAVHSARAVDKFREVPHAEG